VTGSPEPTYRAGARRIAPITVMAAAFGMSFGVLARSADMGTVASIVMSATTFAGSAQFAAASVLAAGGGVAAAITAAVLLNARYAPIGVTAAHAFAGAPWRRLLALPGVGPYAAAHVMMLLGRYSRLVLDSWTRPKYARLNGGRPARDAAIERRFRRYGPYRGLAFWLFLTRDWVA